LTELDDAEAILGYGSRGPNILLGNIELSEVDTIGMVYALMV
jgi:hypothetical protein